MRDASAVRAHAIFTQALGVEPSARVALLEEACGGDESLKTRVLRLLRAAQESEGFLETPALSSAPSAALPVPDAIGNYLVIGVLGTGGMATVYEAVQESPKRHVALKVMHQAMFRTDALLRFRLEAQTLARLHHPGIAQIYEAGTASLGQSQPSPFFAMELVPEALTITRYADTHGFSLRDRLAMFASVCDAVVHGHQHGIIHRDLKPANVLVGREGRAKVIDFGIARSTDAGAPAVTADTDTRRLIGTLNAMSPEQCADPSGIDVRSDVYSLGVILYELVTGRPPHDLSRCSIPEAVRIITHVEPPRASALRPEAAGDLDAIIATAMNKDRERRYTGAGALAADVRRWLGNRPVEARASTALEQVMKFARRNPPLAAALGAAVLCLVGGIVVSSIFAWSAARARDEAIEGKRELEILTAFQESMLAGLDAWAMGDGLRASLAEEVAKTQRDARGGVGAADDASSGGDAAGRDWSTLTAHVNFTSVAVRSLKESILDRYRRAIDDEFAERPVLRARLLHRLVGTMSALGLYADAEPLAVDALALRRSALGADHEETIQSLAALGGLLSLLGRLDESLALLADAHERGVRTLGPFDPTTLKTASSLGGVHRRRGELAEAERLWTQTLESQRRVNGDDHADTLRTLNNLGLLHAVQGRLDEAESCWRELLERRRRTLGAASPEYRGSLGNLGMLLADLGRREEARSMLEEALASDRAHRGDAHPATFIAMAQLAALLEELKEYAAAEALMRECVEGRRVNFGAEHPDTLKATVFLGTLRQRQGDGAEAERIIRACLATQRRTLGDGHHETMDSIEALRDVLRAGQRIEEALELSRELLALVERAQPRRPAEIGHHLLAHGALLADCGRVDEARDPLTRGHALLVESLGADHPRSRRAAERLAEFRRAQDGAQ